MNGELELPECEHNRPFTGVVIVKSPSSFECSFCAHDRLVAELAQLRAEIVQLRTDRDRVWPVWKNRYRIRHKLSLLLRDYPDDKESASIIAAIDASVNR